MEVWPVTFTLLNVFFFLLALFLVFGAFVLFLALIGSVVKSGQPKKEEGETIPVSDLETWLSNREMSMKENYDELPHADGRLIEVRALLNKVQTWNRKPPSPTDAFRYIDREVLDKNN